MFFEWPSTKTVQAILVSLKTGQQGGIRKDTKCQSFIIPFLLKVLLDFKIQMAFTNTIFPYQHPCDHYTEHPSTDLSQTWYTVSIWQGLEAYLFSRLTVKVKIGLWLPYQQPCDHSTLIILRLIWTKLGIQLVYGKV